MATVYSLVCSGGTSGSYWSGLSVSGRARYGSTGNERVFSSLEPAIASLTSASEFDNCIIEIADAFIDSMTSAISITSSHASGSIVITSTIDGVSSSAFHGGSLSASSGGYIALIGGYAAGISISRPYVTIEGVKIVGSGESIFTGLTFSSLAVGCRFTRCIAMPGSSQSTSQLGVMHGNGNIIEHCIFYANGRIGATVNGVIFYSYSGSGGGMYNCLLIGNGVNGQGTSLQATTSNAWSTSNNIILNFATNWSASAPSSGRHTNNVGVTGDTVWDSNSSSISSLVTSWFSNYGSLDFRHASSSPLIGSGVNRYNVSDIDILGNVRPNYNPSGEQNWDIGPFEYDHGNGIAPLQVTLAISGIAEGSILAVYKTIDGSAIISPTTIGESGSHSTTYSYTGDTQIEVVVRKGTSGTKYLPYSAPGLITSTGFSLIVNQVADGVLNG